jgi:hypothetical protein
MNERKWTDVVVPAMAVIALGCGAYYLLGRPACIILLLAGAAYALYLLTFFQRMPAARSILPVYLVAVAWQALHVVEEYVTGFADRFPLLFAGAFSPLEGAIGWSNGVFLAVNAAALALFLFGALGLARGWRIPTIFVCIFALGELLNGLGHPLLALAAGDGWYFPGLFTGVGHLILGVLVVRKVWAVRTPAERALPRRWLHKREAQCDFE